MKKTLLLFAALLIITTAVSAQTAKSLDAVIEESAKTIENALPREPSWRYLTSLQAPKHSPTM